jgi:hypothetical protein
MSEPLSLTENEMKRKGLMTWVIGIGLMFALLGPPLVYGVVKVQQASQRAGMG